MTSDPRAGLDHVTDEHAQRALNLCPVHSQQTAEWHANTYDPRNPSEWPGGRSTASRTLLMDSRTSHDERAREFTRKNQDQIDLIARICTSGTSPQCERPTP